MKKILPIFFAVLFIFFFIPPSVFAVSVDINNVPLTIDQSQELEVDAILSCKGCTTDSYLRGVFYPSGASYFGYTWNNSGIWSNAAGGNCTTYYKIAKADLNPEGSWSGKLKFKPDKESSYYNGPGEYLFKIGRYTPSCSTTWSEEKTISITGPTSSPTPTQVPSPTSTPTPSKTPTPTPTKSPTPIKSGPTAKPTQKSATPTVKPKVTEKSVLGSSTKSPEEKISKSPTPKEQKVMVKGSSVNVLSSVFILLGGGLIIGCGVLIFLKNRR